MNSGCLSWRFGPVYYVSGLFDRLTRAVPRIETGDKSLSTISSPETPREFAMRRHRIPYQPAILLTIVGLAAIGATVTSTLRGPDSLPCLDKDGVELRAQADSSQCAKTDLRGALRTSPRAPAADKTTTDHVD